MLIAPLTSATRFTWDRRTHVAVAEASDLRETRIPSCPLRSDGEGYGFMTQSPSSGRIVIWALARVERDREGEVVAWVHTPWDQDQRYPVPSNMLGWEIHVLND